MKSKLFNLSIICIFLAFAKNVKAKEHSLRVDEVLKSVKAYYPLVLKSLDELDSSKMEVLAAEGLFDSKLSVKKDQRVEGFYEADSIDAVATKPIKLLNGEVYAGFRSSDGNWPLYEGKKETLDEGEARLGLKLSLWRDSQIDKRRARLANETLSMEGSKANTKDVLLKSQAKAYAAYWNWVAKGQIFKIYEKLLEIAKERAIGLKKRIQKGDLAKIYGLENQQYIARRQSKAIKAERDFIQAGLKLALFLRDKEGRPVFVKPDRLPNINELEVKEAYLQENVDKVEKALQLNPKLKQLGLKTKVLENEFEFERNKLNPKLDLRIEVSKDYGQGSKTLRAEEQRLALMLEIPIERNLAKGKSESTAAKRRAVEHQIKYLKEQLATNARAISVKLKSLNMELKNIKQEAELAQKLQAAERLKFKEGGSDFFVVNLREQDAADAKAKFFQRLSKYQETLAVYKQLIMDF